MLTETQDKYQEVLQAAEARYRQSPDWVAFFRDVLGVDGVVRKAFPKFEDLTAFEQSDQYEKIQKLLVKLREKRPSADTEAEPTRVITVRLPKSMHEALRHEAHDLRTSMNKLCISKLLQVIDEELVPSDRASGASNASSSPATTAGVSGTGVSGPAVATAGLSARTHQSSTLGGSPSPANHSYGHSQPQTVPPYKPTQPRF